MSDLYFEMKNRRFKKYEEKEIDGELCLVETEEWKDFKQSFYLQNSVFSKDLPSYVGEDVNGNLPRIESYISEFETKFRNRSLYFWSSRNSTQKTTTAVRIGKELSLKGFKCDFILMNNLSKLLQKSEFGEDESSIQIIKKIQNSDLLIIDDSFDKLKMTVYRSGYQLPFLDGFIRQRIEVQQKATIFTSNYPISSIGESFSPGIQALLERNVFPMEFSDGINDFKVSSMWD